MAKVLEVTAEYVEDFLRKSKYNLTDLLDTQSFVDTLEYIKNIISRVYATPSNAKRISDSIDDILAEHEGSRLAEKWSTIASFFSSSQNKRAASDIVKQVLLSGGSRPLIVVDLSKRPTEISQTDWNEKFKPLLIDRFIRALIDEAERAYGDDRNLNTLVVLDEAHRLAPQGSTGNERSDAIKSNLVDAVRTTRKYGLGWMFLSQTLSSLDKEIVQQLRISFFGFGLSMGSEYQKLRELVGGQSESLKLYQRFRDPHSSFDTESREYSFMTVGPVSPLSFAGTPLFLSAFNSVDDFTIANGLEQQQRMF